MLPRELVSAVTRAAPFQGAEQLADPRQQAFQRALAPLLGKAVHGQVLARLTDGSFVVKVADIAARMQLPPGAQVGADVPLTLVSLQPRATFQVGGQATPAFSEAGPPLPDGADPGKAPLAYREGGSAQQLGAAGRAQALLAQSAAAGAGVLLAGAEARHTTLSPAGKAIGGVLAAALKADAPLGSLVGRAPVVGAPGADAGAIAAGLQQTLVKSGLFYESHVAEWAQGGRPLAELAAEPQQQAAREGARPVALDPATAQFISLQLATQEQAQLTWQGQLWPGQPMEWDVQREAGGDTKQEDGQPAWLSRLRLRFPALGELEANISLAGDTLQLRLSTGSHASASQLRRHAPQLEEALGAAGTRLASFDVRAARDGDAWE
ncbi:flagellar hook-length control protein FliK [Massilia niastensis]|uniref:flagellar hook-length control protein FliK n=1 Tax=Massilia niastensis TaxID=544911 RepID=UPI00036DC284|nr:flagellar hook-length control protein FliK [Massilia niastensis]